MEIVKEKIMNQQKLAKLAYENNMFVPGWQMVEHYFETMNYEDSDYWISMLYEGDMPIAAATFNMKEYFLSVYVKPEFRGNQYGNLIIEQILKEKGLSKDEVYAFIGEDGTEEFYKKNGIACFVDELPIMKDRCLESIKGKSLDYKSIVKILIDEKLLEYKNNVPFPEYPKIYPRTVLKK
jgi:hypothetical protein